MRSLAIGVVLAISVVVRGIGGQSGPFDQRAREIFKELIELNTTDSTGDTTKAAQAVAARLKAAGFGAADVQVIGPNPRKGNLVARYRGTDTRRPLLLLAHLDVVEAKREDWSFDPFTFLEKSGYFYGRGTSDDKAMASILTANLIRLKREGFKPDRDLILALTADEEGGTSNGVQWLLNNRRTLIEAELAINEGGAGQIKGGKYLINEVQASEKIYQDFHLESKNPGGHSSRPTRDNAIYHLSEGLARLGKYEFPVKMNEVTRGYFERMAGFETGTIAADMRAVAKMPPDLRAASRLAAVSSYYNALMRTTCVATRLAGGHADNALPQTATAMLNCRMLPGETAAAVKQKIVEILADPKIVVSSVGQSTPSPASPLTPDVMRPIESITKAMWPSVIVVPVMSPGATDSLYLRNAGIATYGVEGIFYDIDDNRAHGKDERVGVKQYFEGLEFQYRLLRALASPVIDPYGSTTDDTA